MLMRQSSDSSELFTAGRWHDVNMQIPTIQLSSMELVEHQIKYKVIFRVVNKAGLSTTMESSEFMWDEGPSGWIQLPSSLSSESSMSGGLHYVHVGDQVQFSWASQHARYFSVAICNLDAKPEHMAGPPAKCEPLTYVGSSTSFIVSGGMIFPGKALSIQV